MIFAVDFDKTLYLGEYPGIDNNWNMPLINKIKHLQNFHPEYRWILWTCRNADDLEIAVSALRQFNIRWDAINDNLEQQKQLWGNNPRKVYADYYIDDKNLSIPDFLLTE